jgi:Ca-activated chloride channel family protein
VLVVGVGDSRAGSFIDGRHSRQDVSTLRQIANRLGGEYHNGNEHQIGTETLMLVAAPVEATRFEKLTRREYALLACALGALSCAAIPVLLAYFGTRWRPGHQIGRRRSEERASNRATEGAYSRQEFGRSPAQPVS